MFRFLYSLEDGAIQSSDISLELLSEEESKAVSCGQRSNHSKCSKAFLTLTQVGGMEDIAELERAYQNSRSLSDVVTRTRGCPGHP